MRVNCEAKYLNVQEGSFVGQDGREVKYFRISTLPAPDYDPLVFPCTEDVASLVRALGLAKFSDILLGLDVSQYNGNGVRVRAVDVQAV